MRAICPKLYGMHAVKLGMMLVLIGGASIPLGSDGDAMEDKIDSQNEQDAQDDYADSDSDNEAPVAFQIGGNDDDDDDENDDDEDGIVTTKSNRRKKKSKTNRSTGKTVKSRRRIQRA